jgi:diaminopimelate decarboxylase
MINETKQTAVEWLLNEIETKNGEEFSSYYLEFIEQAKEMEKEQIVGFAFHFAGERFDRQDLEKEYNETYGDNK